MSSPISEKRRTLLDRLLVNVHQRSSHNFRVTKLVEVLDEVIKENVTADGVVRALDIGCGDMSISMGLSERRPGLIFDAIDIHELPDSLAGDQIWSRYKVFDGKKIPFEDGTFSFGIMSDVLHHVPESVRAGLLVEALRTCDFVIIKDHLEYGWFSRQMLRLMDFLGNYGYGISVPRGYFTACSLSKLINTLGAKLEIRVPQLNLYAHLPLIRNLCRPKWQFVGVVRPKSANEH